jgi:hypothetical protein
VRQALGYDVPSLPTTLSTKSVEKFGAVCLSRDSDAASLTHQPLRFAVPSLPTSLSTKSVENQPRQAVSVLICVAAQSVAYGRERRASRTMRRHHPFCVKHLGTMSQACPQACPRKLWKSAAQSACHATATRHPLRISHLRSLSQACPQAFPRNLWIGRGATSCLSAAQAQRCTARPMNTAQIARPAPRGTDGARDNITAPAAAAPAACTARRARPEQARSRRASASARARAPESGTATLQRARSPDR